MPAKRKLTMRQLRQMLRLARDGASSREIARVLGVARSTVQENLKRAADAGLSWPLPGELTDDALEAAAVRPGRGQAGHPPSPGAQLGRAGHRSEEARRHHDGALGGVPGGPARRVRLQSLLRAVPRLRAPAAAEHAAGSCRRRQGLRRLLRQEDRRSSIRTPARCARRRSSWPCSAPRTSPTPRRPGPSRCRTGSVRTSGCSASSAACRAWSCPTI